MNLVDELLKIDSKKADELKKGVFKSKRLATLLGSKEETVDVTISEIPSRRINDIVGYQFNKNGSFDITVLSSSRFFKLELSSITSKDGELTALVNIKSKSYKYIYLGTAEEASKADESKLIPVTIDGEHSHFEIPLKSLNSDVPCAAFSIKRQKWYNRNIVFDASSLPDKALNFKTPNYDLIEKSTKEYIEKHNLSKDVLGEKPKQIETTEDQNTVKKILAVAFAVMIVGGVLNHLLKRRRR